jgi:hypothetical protein
MEQHKADGTRQTKVHAVTPLPSKPTTKHIIHTLQAQLLMTDHPVTDDHVTHCHCYNMSLTRSHLLSSSRRCLCRAFLRMCCSRNLQRVPSGSRASSTCTCAAQQQLQQHSVSEAADAAAARTLPHQQYKHSAHHIAAAVPYCMALNGCQLPIFANPSHLSATCCRNTATMQHHFPGHKCICLVIMSDQITPLPPIASWASPV